MGLFKNIIKHGKSLFNNAKKRYSDVKSLVSRGASWAKGMLKSASKFAEKHKDVPFVGKALSSGIEALHNVNIGGKSIGDILNMMENMGVSPKDGMEQLGMQTPSVLDPNVSANDKVKTLMRMGNEADRARFRTSAGGSAEI